MKLTKKNVVAAVMSALMVLGTSMFVSCDNGSTTDDGQETEQTGGGENKGGEQPSGDGQTSGI